MFQAVVRRYLHAALRGGERVAQVEEHGQVLHEAAGHPLRDGHLHVPRPLHRHRHPRLAARLHPLLPHLLHRLPRHGSVGSFHSIGGGGGERCSSVVRAFAHGAMDRRIDHSWRTH